MKEHHGHLDPIEAALRELGAAERAQVFDRTRIDPTELLAIDPIVQLTTLRSRILRWVPVAAAIGMVVFVGTSVFTPHSEPLALSGKTAADRAIDDRTPCADTFLDYFTCRTGPGAATLADACLAYDYDGDNDVDQADLRTYQNCTRRRQMNQ